MPRCLRCRREIPVWRVRWGQGDEDLNRMRSFYARVYACPHCGNRFSVEITSQLKGIVAVLACCLAVGAAVRGAGVSSDLGLLVALVAACGAAAHLWWRHGASLRSPF